MALMALVAEDEYLILCLTKHLHAIRKPKHLITELEVLIRVTNKIKTSKQTKTTAKKHKKQ